MGDNTYDALVNISEGNEYSNLVVTLQYEVMQNRLGYIGICGAAKWAGYDVELKGGPRRGLELFGRNVSVNYGHWMDEPSRNITVIEINEVNYCIVDTDNEIAGCAVMCQSRSHSEDQKARYARKAAGIQENLNGVLDHLRSK